MYFRLISETCWQMLLQFVLTASPLFSREEMPEITVLCEENKAKINVFNVFGLNNWTITECR